MGKSKSKYGNVPVVVDGIKFQSTKEGYYYLYLKRLEGEGKISDLRLQVPYEIIPAVYEKTVRHLRTKDKVEEKCIQEATHYIADFVYIDNETGKEVVVDVKSEATAKKESYILKKKMMLAFNGIRIKEYIY